MASKYLAAWKIVGDYSGVVTVVLNNERHDIMSAHDFKQHYSWHMFCKNEEPINLYITIDNFINEYSVFDGSVRVIVNDVEYIMLKKHTQYYDQFITSESVFDDVFTRIVYFCLVSFLRGKHFLNFNTLLDHLFISDGRLVIGCPDITTKISFNMGDLIADIRIFFNEHFDYHIKYTKEKIKDFLWGDVTVATSYSIRSKSQRFNKDFTDAEFTITSEIKDKKNTSLWILYIDLEDEIIRLLDENYQLITYNFVKINPVSVEIRTFHILAHGTQCTEESCSREVITTFELPKNIVVLMNCNLTVSMGYGKLETYKDLLSNNIFADIQKDYTTFTKKVEYIKQILEIWRINNSKLCVFKGLCPDIHLEFYDTNPSKPIWMVELPSTLNPNEYLEKNTNSSVNTFKLSELIDRYTRNHKFQENNLNVLLVNSCRATNERTAKMISTRNIGIPLDDPTDPVAHVYIFWALWEKLSGTHSLYQRGGSHIKYNMRILGRNRRLYVKDRNIYLKYKGKDITLLTAIKLDKTFQQALTLYSNGNKPTQSRARIVT